MSRSKKGGKGVGAEFWSRRPTSNKGGSEPNKETKKRTHKLERIENKKKTKDTD